MDHSCLCECLFLLTETNFNAILTQIVLILITTCLYVIAFSVLSCSVVAVGFSRLLGISVTPLHGKGLGPFGLPMLGKLKKFAHLR